MLSFLSIYSWKRTIKPPRYMQVYGKEKEKPKTQSRHIPKSFESITDIKASYGLRAILIDKIQSRENPMAKIT